MTDIQLLAVLAAILSTGLLPPNNDRPREAVNQAWLILQAAREKLK